MRAIAKFMLTLTFFAYACTGNSVQSKNFSIKVKVRGIKDSTIYLANYFAEKLYYIDTIKLNAKGEGEFTNANIKAGLYAVVLPFSSGQYFDVLVNEPKIVLEVDTVDFYKNMKVVASKENQALLTFILFNNKKQEEAMKTQNLLQNNELSDVLKNSLVEELKNLGKEIEQFKDSLIKENPNSLFEKLMILSGDIEVPAIPAGEKDSLWQYKYYKAHYFDQYDFNDERLLRTPFYKPRLERFFNQVLVQHPDTILAEADRLLSKTVVNEAFHKFTVAYIFDNAVKSKYMGMDKVYARIARKYYLTDGKYQVKDMDTSFLAKIRERVDAMEPTLVGETAPEIKLPGLDRKTQQSLHAIKANYIVVYVYSPTCGHCKTATPVLVKALPEIKQMGGVVYAINDHVSDLEEWKKFVKEYKMEEFINVSAGQDFPDYSYIKNYDVMATPHIIILDKNKKVIARQLSVEQILDVIQANQKETK